jgi:hypothetical protein
MNEKIVYMQEYIERKKKADEKLNLYDEGIRKDLTEIGRLIREINHFESPKIFK